MNPVDFPDTISIVPKNYKNLPLTIKYYTIVGQMPET